MSRKWWRRSGIAGLILSVACAAGCGGGEPPPTTVERPGPAIPKKEGVLKQGAAGKKAVRKSGP
jgi:hypothetical protein